MIRRIKQTYSLKKLGQEDDRENLSRIRSIKHALNAEDIVVLLTTPYQFSVEYFTLCYWFVDFLP